MVRRLQIKFGKQPELYGEVFLPKASSMKYNSNVAPGETDLVRRLQIKFGKQPELYGEVFLPKASSSPLPGAILCHGLGSGKETVRSSALDLANHGIAALIFDFRGHGRSQGIFDGNDAEDVVTAWQWLSRFDGINPRKIALIGHSMGARAAILAASLINAPANITILSCPPDVENKPDDNASLAIQYLINRGNPVKNYPKDGVLPWLSGAQAIASRLWMYSRGYRLRINWQQFVSAMPERKILSALVNLGCSKLFVHARGDKYIPYQTAMELYDKAAGPKELILGEGGHHSTPLMPGDLRKKWINWVTDVLTNGQHPDIVKTN